MRGQIELQVVKMKLSTTGRPSLISSGSETTLPSSLTSRTEGTKYCEVEVVVRAAAEAGAECSSASSFANPREAANTSSAPAMRTASRARSAWRWRTAARVRHPIWRRVRAGDRGSMDQRVPYSGCTACNDTASSTPAHLRQSLSGVIANPALSVLLNPTPRREYVATPSLGAREGRIRSGDA